MKKVGDKVPQVSLKDANGRSWSVNHPPKPTVLALFKVGCPTCQYAFPFLERLHNSSPHLQVIGVSQDSPADTKDFGQRFGITFPLLLDDNGYMVSKSFGITIVPSIFLVQTNDTISQVTEGWVRSEFEDLAKSGEPSAPPALFKPGEQVAEFKAG